MKRFILPFILAAFLVVPTIAYAANYPHFTGYVNDFAHVLKPSTISQLNATLTRFDQHTTNQIAVVTIGTTQPETIEEYSIHLADNWKVGQKGKDNGVIMLFAMQDHRMRIEVGRGLEGDLTDIQSKHIQTDIIEPSFKQGNYDIGVTDGVNAVIATISHDPSATQSAQIVHPKGGINPFLVFAIIALIVIVIVLSIFTPLGGVFLLLPNIFFGGGIGDNNDDQDNHGGGFGGFGGGDFSGGGSSDSW